jgi:hypothetical protein
LKGIPFRTLYNSAWSYIQCEHWFVVPTIVRSLIRNTDNFFIHQSIFSKIQQNSRHILTNFS